MYLESLKFSIERVHLKLKFPRIDPQFIMINLNILRTKLIDLDI